MNSTQTASVLIAENRPSDPSVRSALTVAGGIRRRWSVSVQSCALWGFVWGGIPIALAGRPAGG